MSEANVVALVPVTGRAGVGAPDGVPVVRLAVRRLIGAASVDRVILLPESELDLSVSAVLDIGDVRVVSGSALSEYAAVVAAQPGVRVVLVHDPLRAFTPVDVVDRVVLAVLADGRPVVPVLPCSDTVKQTDDAGVVIDTPDRAWLRVVQTPIGYPAELISSGAVVAGEVPAGALLVAGDPKARRVAGAVDLVMIDGGLT
jgi:2-C-methyl-D-erythritol 4-phosphate cytidylyltransferase